MVTLSRHRSCLVAWPSCSNTAYITNPAVSGVGSSPNGKKGIFEAGLGLNVREFQRPRGLHWYANPDSIYWYV
jgi:hypothetical protein